MGAKVGGLGQHHQEGHADGERSSDWRGARGAREEQAAAACSRQAADRQVCWVRGRRRGRGCSEKQAVELAAATRTAQASTPSSSGIRSRRRRRPAAWRNRRGRQRHRRRSESAVEDGHHGAQERARRGVVVADAVTVRKMSAASESQGQGGAAHPTVVEGNAWYVSLDKQAAPGSDARLVEEHQGIGAQGTCAQRGIVERVGGRVPVGVGGKRCRGGRVRPATLRKDSRNGDVAHVGVHEAPLAMAREEGTTEGNLLDRAGEEERGRMAPAGAARLKSRDRVGLGHRRGERSDIGVNVVEGRRVVGSSRNRNSRIKRCSCDRRREVTQGRGWRGGVLVQQPPVVADVT